MLKIFEGQILSLELWSYIWNIFPQADYLSMNGPISAGEFLMSTMMMNLSTVLRLKELKQQGMTIYISSVTSGYNFLSLIYIYLKCQSFLCPNADNRHYNIKTVSFFKKENISKSGWFSLKIYITSRTFGSQVDIFLYLSTMATRTHLY